MSSATAWWAILSIEKVDAMRLNRAIAGQAVRHAGYNAELTIDGLRAPECSKISPEAVQRLDSVKAIEDLQEVGSAVAERDVRQEHFNFPVFAP